jgi:hypothetical protein
MSRSLAERTRRVLLRKQRFRQLEHQSHHRQGVHGRNRIRQELENRNVVRKIPDNGQSASPARLVRAFALWSLRNMFGEAARLKQQTS